MVFIIYTMVKTKTAYNAQMNENELYRRLKKAEKKRKIIKTNALVFLLFCHSVILPPLCFAYLYSHPG